MPNAIYFYKYLFFEVDDKTMYAEMLSLGITVDMVRKYTGDDNADRMERALGMQDMLVF